MSDRAYQRGKPMESTPGLTVETTGPVDLEGDPEKSPHLAGNSDLKPVAKPKTDDTLNNRGKFFMACLALQYGWQPLMTKECIGPDVQKSSIVIFQEVFKFGLSFTMLFMEGGWTLWNEVVANSRGKGKPWTLASSASMALPLACMYGVQNWLLFYSAGNMEPLTFNLVNQSKLIWTAFFLYFVMAKPQSPMQVVAIFMMMGAAFLLSMKAGTAEKGEAETDFIHGVVPNLGAALISGLAAAYTQKYTQRKGSPAQASLLFTMELCTWQTIFMFVITPVAAYVHALLLDADATALAAQAAADAAAAGNVGFFSGWFWYTPMPILNNAAGGIFTGQVIQHAGGVRKGFAVVGALILTAVFQYMYYGTPLKPQLYIALPVCVAANVIYSRFPYKA